MAEDTSCLTLLGPRGHPSYHLNSRRACNAFCVAVSRLRQVLWIPRYSLEAQHPVLQRTARGAQCDVNSVAPDHLKV